MNVSQQNTGTVIKGHLLTGISWMIPLIVAAGICIAPGLIIGFICGQIQTGFIGGILGGFLVGYTVLLLRRVIKLPASMQGLMPVMILPVLSTIIAGLLMMTFIGQPIVWLQKALIHLLESMQGGSRFLMGAILGAMATFDFGGPVNKTMSLFADGLLVDGIYGPEAVKFVGSIIPPFGITLSFLLTRYKYTRAEKEALKAAFPMGICMITEGVIPIAARDLLRVVASCVVASAIAGGLIMVWGVEAPVPHGGMFVVPLFTRPVMFCLALGIGTVVCGVMLSLLRKRVTEADEEFDDVEDKSVRDEDIKFTLE